VQLSEMEEHPSQVFIALVVITVGVPPPVKSRPLNPPKYHLFTSFCEKEFAVNKANTIVESRSLRIEYKNTLEIVFLQTKSIKLLGFKQFRQIKITP